MTNTICLVGSPEEIGEHWGSVNKSSIQTAVAQFVDEANNANVDEDQLIVKSQVFINICNEWGCGHWIEEAVAIASKACPEGYSIDQAEKFKDLYVAYIALGYRNLWDDCTSYAVGKARTSNNNILFHKNRDNKDKPQAACIIKPIIAGMNLNKFITVTDTSVLTCMMMVNDKGLAGSANTGGDPGQKKYDGLMNTFILRYIAENASTWYEALYIIMKFLEKKHYAGGDATGTHWLFVDKEGNIVEIIHSNDAIQKIRFYNENEICFTAEREGLKEVLEKYTEIDFHAFHNISRDPRMCKSYSISSSPSISGMTVEISPDYPEMLTCAWICFPAKALAFPLFMGCNNIPEELANGYLYEIFRDDINNLNCNWQHYEKNIHVAKNSILNSASNNINEATQMLEHWVFNNTANNLEEVKEIYGWEQIGNVNNQFIYATPDSMFVCTGQRVKYLLNGVWQDWKDFSDYLDDGEIFTCIASTDSNMYGLTNFQSIYRWTYSSDSNYFEKVGWSNNWYLCADKDRLGNCHLYACTGNVIKELRNGQWYRVFLNINERFNCLAATEDYFYGLTPCGKIKRFAKNGNGLDTVGRINNRYLFAQSKLRGYSKNELYNCCNLNDVKRLENGKWEDFIFRQFDVICTTESMFYGLRDNKIYRVRKCVLYC